MSAAASIEELGAGAISYRLFSGSLQYPAGCNGPNVRCNTLHGSLPHSSVPHPSPNSPPPTKRVALTPLAYGSLFAHAHCPLIDRDSVLPWQTKQVKKGLVHESPSFPFKEPRQRLLWKEHLLLIWRQLMAFPVYTIIILRLFTTAIHVRVDWLYSWLVGPLYFVRMKHK